MEKMFVFIFILFFGSFSFSLVQTQIFVQQKQTALVFQVEAKSSESQKTEFRLSSEVRILSVAGFQVHRPASGEVVLGLLPSAQGQIQYQIPVVPESGVFKSSDQLWLPLLKDSSGSLKQEISVRTSLEPGYQWIDSGSGLNQQGVDFAICKCFVFQSADQRLRVYLQKNEPELASQILNKLSRYMSLFESRYGSYPFEHFSVVESPDEIGFAFRRMTWIGSQLLHFPFILDSSLPHELLHSWWGHGVAVDASSGNWCEALTTFGADYGLLSEAEKKIYRLKAITSYLNYARNGNEIPLSQFRSRGEDRSLQAIGYDKALMVLVMAEQRMGELAFQKALRLFYSTYRDRAASFHQFFQTLEKVSGQSWQDFENYWLYSQGLVNLDFLNFKWGLLENSLQWSSQASEIKKIPRVPVQVQFRSEAGVTQALIFRVNQDASQVDLQSEALRVRATKLSLDPDFFLMRDLHESEQPKTFSQIFGSQEIFQFQLFSSFEKDWAQVFPNVRLKKAPGSIDFNFKQIYILNSQQVSEFPQVQEILRKKDSSFGRDSFVINGKNYSSSNASGFVILKVQQSTVVILHFSDAQAVQRILSRWSHYGSKSFLVLGQTQALDQGLWLDSFEQNLLAF